MADFADDLRAAVNGADGDDGDRARCDAEALLAAREILKDRDRLKAAQDYVAKLRRAVTAAGKGDAHGQG